MSPSSGPGRLLVAPFAFPAVLGRLESVCPWWSRRGAGDGGAGGGLCGDLLMSGWLWAPRRPWDGTGSSVVDIGG